MLLVALVDVEVLETGVLVELVALIRLPGEHCCAEGLQGAVAATGSFAHYVFHIGAEGDIRTVEVDGHVACVEVGGHVVLIGGMYRGELENDAEGIEVLLIAGRHGDDARGGIVGAFLGDVSLLVAERGVMLVDGKRQAFVEGKLVGVGVDLHVEGIAPLDIAGLVGGEVDGLIGCVLEMKRDRNRAACGRRCDRRRRLHGKGQKSESEQKRDNHAQEVAAGCWPRGGWTVVIHENLLSARANKPRGTGARGQVFGCRQ